jgi:VIT1/CCC1 family predicted Fe2+/Mn2+ transporter
MVLAEADTTPPYFHALGRKYGLLLYIGIFESELAFARSHHAAELIEGWSQFETSKRESRAKKNLDAAAS